MTKRRTTQTQPESLSKQGKQWLSEVDWDLLDQMDLEEEGQHLPMQDVQSTTENPDYSQPYVREEINWEPELIDPLVSDQKTAEKDQLFKELDDLIGLNANFHGYVCFRDRYDPAQMGWDVVVEILEHNLVLIDERRSQEILSSEEITDEEQAALKSFILNDVENSGGDETSYWIGMHPNLYTMAFVGMYQYEDGSREVAGIFDTVDDALKFSKEAGFDLVGK